VTDLQRARQHVVNAVYGVFRWRLTVMDLMRLQHAMAHVLAAEQRRLHMNDGEDEYEH